MKASPFAVIAFALCSGCVGTKDPLASFMPHSAEVVFTREESNGSLNVLQSTITCGGWARLVMTGGDAGSIFLREGDYDFEAVSPAPYQHESLAYTCRSNVLHLAVRSGERVHVEILPELSDDSTTLHWSLKRPSKKLPGVREPK